MSSNITVTPYGDDGHTVTAGDTGYRVLPSTALGWGIYSGPNLDIAPTDGGGFAIGFQSADDAITAIRDTYREEVDEA